MEMLATNKVAPLEERVQLYQTYCRTSHFGIRVGGPREKTSFDHRTRTAILSTADAQPGRSQLLVDFDIFHELGHLMQLFTDPDGYEKLIDDCQSDSAKFTFYNCLLDVAVNSFIPNRSAIYRGQNGETFSPLVKDYYRDTLFSEKDLSSKPLCIQFSYLLLLEGMDCAESYRVSDEVKAVLDQPIKLFGQKKRIGDLVRETFRERNPPNDFTVSNLRSIADKTLLPLFEKLREEDQRRGTVIVAEELRPIFFHPCDLNNAIRSAKELKSEANTTADERASRVVKESILKDLEKSPTADEFAERCARLRAEILEMAELWRKIRRVEREMSVTESVGHPRGHRLDIRQTIGHFSELHHPNVFPPIMVRSQVDEQLRSQPKLIELDLLLDLSGSMEDCLEFLKDAFIIIYGSIDSYSRSREEDWPEIHCALHVYSDTSKTVVPLGPHHLSDFFSAYTKLIADGGTKSHLGLELVTSSIDKRGSSEQVTRIFAELTDGETEDVPRSRALVDGLKQRGVICSGIRLLGATRADRPDPNGARIVGETGSFFEMYGDRGRAIQHRDFLRTFRELLGDLIDADDRE